MDWLSRALARGGVLSAEEAEEAIRAGRVQVDGRLVHQPMTAVTAQTRIRLDGHPISLDHACHVLAFHKPAGLVTAPEDRHGAGTVFEWLLRKLPPEWVPYGWHAVGRLDRDTRGLLLFTNDERVVAHVTSPQRQVLKVYRAEVGARVTDEKLGPLREGVELADGIARAAHVSALSEREVELALTEGRNHQAKRMLGAVGLPVLQLTRIRIGDISLDVAEGEYRMLEREEVEKGLGFAF